MNSSVLFYLSKNDAFTVNTNLPSRITLSNIKISEELKINFHESVTIQNSNPLYIKAIIF